jgi:hypothetical protein
MVSALARFGVPSTRNPPARRRLGLLFSPHADRHLMFDHAKTCPVRRR